MPTPAQLLLASSIGEIEVPVLMVISALIFAASLGVACGAVITTVRTLTSGVQDLGKFVKELGSCVNDIRDRVVKLETRFEDYADR